jgi:tetratricopeptide (TPR) repeat protein
VRSTKLSRRAVVLIAAALGLWIASACAPKNVPPPTAAFAKFPDFVFPTVPPGLGTPATVERHKAGWQWLQAGDLRAADRNFAASLKLSPEFYPADVGLGYVALARNAHEAALVHFDRAVIANPRYAPALIGRGDVLLATGRRAEALDAFEAAVAADPSLGALRSRIEVLRFRGLQEDVAQARKSAESGRLMDARKAYQQAIAASPQSAFLYRELALVERRDRDLAAALGHARKAAELEPGDARTIVLIGEILEAQGELESAIESYSAAVALEPNDTIESRIEELREKAALAGMPEEFRSIEASPNVTRAQLAALIGVRLHKLLKRFSGSNAVVITDTRGSWAAPWILSVAGAGVMEVYPNHTFQPSALVRRSDLARAASRVLSLIAAERPTLAASWRNAAKRRFQDVSQGHLSYPAVSLTVEAGVLQPQQDGSFQLSRPATGAEAVAAVKKLEELAEKRSP